MDEFWRTAGFDLPELSTIIRISSRLLGATLLAAFVGWEREQHGRAAGLRTHMMVALGAALFTLVPLEVGASTSEVARIVHGVAAGVGFLGAGAILKIASEKDVLGLTTASSIWLTAAIGLSVGAGQFWSALVATILSLIVLVVLRHLERPIDKGSPGAHKPAPAENEDVAEEEDH